MDDAQRSFRKREQALRRKHIRMSQGYVTRMNRNGVIEQIPDRKIGGFGFQVALRLCLVLMGFKVMALVWLGEDNYANHVAALASGAIHEKAGAWIMQIDPVTRTLAGYLTPVIG
ncbi:hypothetical protein [Mameliella sediminis]|uniref:hypothetical protein n=1 Tax=Mameliella sediminis TaxID=2836866 RepID=UPI001C484683|nr:hypothetical protein [Mameliella sediminis]MBY6113570.1 hypothetical protein [Antarctobacter heliothermus]MBY6143082.1 hypothetical protein [Mameliella alba]MBV7394868.1 hypothetical protein [Mameliella sediminis]MBY6159937.1 hypothetical protein [Mameliella alba]MBY6168408.1 hypothetical protein [Mameliella alba]